MKSIAQRLFWTQLVASMCLAVGVGLLLYARVSSSLSAQFDESLGGRATSLAALMRIGPKGLLADFHASSLPELSRRGGIHFLQVTDESGHPLYRSQSLGDATLPATVDDERVRYRNVQLPDGRPGRYVTLRFTPTFDDDAFDSAARPATAPSTMFLTFAQSRQELDERLRSFVAALCLAAAVLCIGIVGVTVLTMKTGVSHLRRFATDVEHLDIAQLTGRVEAKQIPAELVPIATRLNQLLDRLEQAFSRERRFTGNAAHELRTPITELRTLAEVALRNGTTDNDEFYRDALAIAKQMESLVQALLAMARGQSQRESDLQVIDASAVVESAWTGQLPGVAGRQLVATAKVEPGLHVLADAASLTSVYGNLLNNAVSHAARGGQVDWTLNATDGQIRLQIENTNDTLTPADLANLSEPFWRKSAARTSGQHSGLGLALVKAWADLLDARLTFDLSPDGRRFKTVFTLRQATPIAG